MTIIEDWINKMKKMKNTNGFAKLTADIIIEFDDGNIILIKRGHSPFKGHWAIPGGKMEGDETIQETAVREAKEETGLDVSLTKLIGVYSKANRDPRGRFVSVVFTATPIGGILKASSDAKEILKTSEFLKLDLAFDHNQILIDYINSKR